MVGIGLANGFLENGADTLSPFFLKLSIATLVELQFLEKQL